ncbi:hypothetical protein KEJ50_05535 [Candidatus Bathyarchaeota archaeon]|nr:hypothetical protein [Candidatus Bathyarchaeota archaeon]
MYRIVLMNKTVVECERFETVGKGAGLVMYPYLDLFIKAKKAKIENKNFEEIIIPITSIIYIYETEGKRITF